MLGRDSEDEMWSRFVLELVIWPQEVILVRWTQPSGPLCLWQCLDHRSLISISQKILIILPPPLFDVFHGRSSGWMSSGCYSLSFCLLSFLPFVLLSVCPMYLICNSSYLFILIHPGSQLRWMHCMILCCRCRAQICDIFGHQELKMPK